MCKTFVISKRINHLCKTIFKFVYRPWNVILLHLLLCFVCIFTTRAGACVCVESISTICMCPVRSWAMNYLWDVYKRQPVNFMFWRSSFFPSFFAYFYQFNYFPSLFYSFWNLSLRFCSNFFIYSTKPKRRSSARSPDDLPHHHCFCLLYTSRCV